ncbi:MAG: hypothetical protein QOD46_1449 [Actinomycetota bacterium]|jgi:hypothetical protein|nr:hypothetical protein [Actinomycetota bacterium]
MRGEELIRLQPATVHHHAPMVLDRRSPKTVMESGPHRWR